MSKPESSDCDESSSSDDDSSSTDETPSSEPSDPGSEPDQCPKKKGKKSKKARKEQREKMTDHLPVFKPLVYNGQLNLSDYHQLMQEATSYHWYCKNS